MPDTNSLIVFVQVVLPQCIEKMDHFHHQTLYPTLWQYPIKDWIGYTQYPLYLLHCMLYTKQYEALRLTA